MVKYSYIKYYKENEKVGEKNTSPTMTQDEFYLPAKQRVQNLLIAGRNLMDYRSSLNEFEQTDLNVNEEVFDKTTLFDDLHDYNDAVQTLNVKYSKRGTEQKETKTETVSVSEPETPVEQG